MTNQEIINDLKQGKKFSISISENMEILKKFSIIEGIEYYYCPRDDTNIYFNFGRKYLKMTVVVNFVVFTSKIEYKEINFIDDE